MVKKLITEISEEDFRKLDLKATCNKLVEQPDGSKRYASVEISLNKQLDEEIEACLKSGYEEDHTFLTLPVTVAIHEENGYYLDKFMNRFTGAQSFQIGLGIGHLYSSRDYYYDKYDYWRVSKKETKLIYRIHLDSKWLDKFVLKHKTEITDWPYDKLPEKAMEDYDKLNLIIHYTRKDETDNWHEDFRVVHLEKGNMGQEFRVDKDGNRIPPEWEEPSVGDPCSK